MPHVIVGGTKTECRWAEYIASRLSEGQPVRFRLKPGMLCGAVREGVGVFQYSWWYDGVNANIDCGGKTVTAMLGFGDMIWREKQDRSFWGEGI